MIRPLVLVSLILVVALGAHGLAQPSSMTTAKGTFDVKMKPQPVDDYTDATAMARMVIDKVYHGDLDGTAKGQMLTAMGNVKESGVYVAVEKFVGTVHGKHGSFSMHHTGIMNRGAQALTITVVPDSGTGDLTGISGTLTIDIAKDGTHSYALQYTLAPKP